MTIRLMLFMVFGHNWFGVPNLLGILGNVVVAGEFAG